MADHLFIPDVQIAPGVPTHHLRAIGNLIVDRRPDVIIQIGDFADMPSLSLYDVGKKQMEGRRYRDDIESARRGMEELLKPLRDLNSAQRKSKKKIYSPRMVLTLGNHEHRITRATDLDAKLDGAISINDLGYEDFGWEVYPFLEPVTVDGVTYVHYVQQDNSPGAVSRAHLIAARRHGSYSVGHRQTFDYYISPNINNVTGARTQVLMAGACYLHDEGYQGPQGNRHWRGLVYKHGVVNGQYDIESISIERLLRVWG